ncbi:hypothetical protein [Actinoplanes sp. NPDC051411]|uniref:hypothetical protein n=1 Tax=Actinoplanes sp. NPDC051411 TaxID=3155522 RepID=UPI00341F121A
MGSPGRGLRCAAAVTLGLVAAFVAVPAHAMNYGPGTPVTWTVTDSADPGKAQVDPLGDTPLGSFVVDGVKHTRRAYFTYDLTSFRGQVLHRATLSATETAVTDCGTAGPVEVWRTGPGSPISWNRPPAEVELVGHADFGKGALCPGAYLGVDVLAQVDAAISRGDKTISFEARIAAGAESRALAGRMMQPFRLTIWGNHAPTLSGLGLRGPERDCGTPQEMPTAGGRTTLTLHVTDADREQPRSVQFAIWPVDHPARRTQIRGGYGVDPTAVADLSGYPDGTVLAWAGQARDGDDASPWSSPCFLTVDNTAPRTPPTVRTTDCTGVFVVDGAGDPDTVAFHWSARGSSGQARGDHAQIRVGGDEVTVNAVDAAGNRGPDVAYACTPPAVDAPGVSVPALVAGVAGTITLSSPVTGVVAYEYDFGDGRRRVDAGPEGTAQLPWAPGHSGTYTLTVSAVTATGELSGSRERSFDVVDPRPALRSGRTVPGAPTLVTIASALPDGSEYRYSVDGGAEHPVRFAPEVTVPVANGATSVSARVKRSDGTLTPAGTLTLPVSSAPVIKPVPDLGVPAVAGRIGTVTLAPARPGVVAYRYSFGDGVPEQTVAARPDGTADADFTPGRPGWRVLTAVSVDSDGRASDRADYPIVVADPAVQVTASWPASGEALGMGVPGTFGFLGDLTDETTGYLWHVDDTPVRTTPRDADEAITSVAFTPDHTGPNTLAVQRRFRDGSLSPVTEYHFDVGTMPRIVADPGRGVPGKPTAVTFAAGMPNVVSFDYQVVGDSDGAVDTAGTVLADEDGAAQITFIPPSADNYRVIVTGHTADGTATDTATLKIPAYL